MPFQTLPVKSKGKRYFFSSGTSPDGKVNNPGEFVKIGMTNLPSQRLQKIKINTFYNDPGLVYSFLFFFPNDTRLNMPLPPSLAGQFAYTDDNGSTVNPTTGVVINVDATLTRQTEFILNTEGIQLIYVMSIADIRLHCQAEIEFVIEEGNAK